MLCNGLGLGDIMNEIIISKWKLALGTAFVFLAGFLLGRAFS